MQYADDTTAMLQDIESAKLFFEVTRKFSFNSGLKLNVEKTEGLWIGANRKNNVKPLGISWPEKPLKLLGLYIGHNEKD